MKKVFLPFLFFLIVQQSYGQCWESVAAGTSHTLAIKTNGTLWSWGRNNWGQLGLGNFTNTNIPTQIGLDSNWKAISVFAFHNLAIKKDGTLWVWGWNNEGQLGDGTFLNRNAPFQLSADTNWKAIAAGYSHSVALKNNGTIWLWGDNNLGALGNGTYNSLLFPTQTNTDSDWGMISATNVTRALKTDGSLWGWGGQLDPSPSVVLVPTRIGTENDWKSVSAGNNRTLLIKTNGTYWAWGRNVYGELGDGTTGYINIRKQIGTDIDWKSIKSGTDHSIGIKTDGSLWTWGYNDAGQCGSSTNGPLQFLVPTRLGTDNDWKQVAPGSYHSMAIKNDGSLWGFGSNSNGTIGIGSSPGIVDTLALVSCSATTSILSPKKQTGKLLLFPNPASQTITIKTTALNKNGDIVLSSPNGQVLCKWKAISNNITLDISAFRRGMYFLKWQNASEVYVERLILE